ncbi:unnamed protein product [Spirodela intermedia]|uniref:Uncharacterized protein n=1 Tax=Spirodela intermedia TaxID=51605 RepID=A0A7I8JL02_SPIIN|nr:unnamed protein product [Spirodela intermedia]CAA6670834.1 unnamed protein product [Spirodela intermedia]
MLLAVPTCWVSYWRIWCWKKGASQDGRRPENSAEISAWFRRLFYSST